MHLQASSEIQVVLHQEDELCCYEDWEPCDLRRDLPSCGWPEISIVRGTDSDFMLSLLVEKKSLVEIYRAFRIFHGKA